MARDGNTSQGRRRRRRRQKQEEEGRRKTKEDLLCSSSSFNLPALALTQLKSRSWQGKKPIFLILVWACSKPNQIFRTFSRHPAQSPLARSSSDLEIVCVCVKGQSYV